MQPSDVITFFNCHYEEGLMTCLLISEYHVMSLILKHKVRFNTTEVSLQIWELVEPRFVLRAWFLKSVYVIHIS